MKTKEDCIFCKIIKGEIPSKKIYEDEKVIAILDAFPVTKGHTLVVPKGHYENIYDIPEDVLSNVTIVTKDLVAKYKGILNPIGVNILQANGKRAGQSVFHYHMHLVPRYNNDGIDLWFHKFSKPSENLDEVFELLKGKINSAL